jgi:hypothetical protein
LTAQFISDWLTDYSQRFSELTRHVDYAKVPNFHLEVDQEAIGMVSLKSSHIKRDRSLVAERQCPRDVEIEAMEFSTESNRLLSQDGSDKDTGVKECTLSLTEEGTSPIGDRLREETLLVSLNYSRPKKKKVSVTDGHILLMRPNGTQNGTHKSVPFAKILLVTQRPAGEGTIGLTVFWGSDAPDIYPIENAEMFFPNMDSLTTWKLELARIQAQSQFAECINTTFGSSYDSTQLDGINSKFKIVLRGL